MYTLGVRRTPNQVDSDVTCSRSCDQEKIIKKEKIGLKEAGLKKNGFKKAIHTFFVF